MMNRVIDEGVVGVVTIALGSWIATSVLAGW